MNTICRVVSDARLMQRKMRAEALPTIRWCPDFLRDPLEPWDPERSVCDFCIHKERFK